MVHPAVPSTGNGRPAPDQALRTSDPDSAHWTRDPSGLLICLPAEQLSESDEYGSGDPYSLESNLDSVFNQNRLEATLRLVGRVVERVGARARVLDVGCGVGIFSQRVLATYPEIELHGLDYSISAVREAKTRIPDAHLVVASAYDPPYVDGYFDLCLLNNIWEHVPDPLRMLASLRKVLAPGGYVVISTPNRYRIENLARVLRGKPVALVSRAHITEYSVGQVREQLASAGFESIGVHAPSYIAKTGTLKKRVVATVLEAWLRATRSHHSLEPTLFFIAQKPAQSSRPEESDGRGRTTG